MDQIPFITAFITGMVGSIHCVGMCGGISSALQLGLKTKTPTTSLYFSMLYNTGRILSYITIGWLAGWLGYGATKAMGINSGVIYLRLFGAFVLLLMAAHIAQWWTILSKFEAFSQKMFNPMKKWSKNFLPIQKFHQAFIIGLFWGWLPCGLVYSSLAYAASMGSPSRSALTMMSFGLGTLPTLLLMGSFAQQLTSVLQKRQTKQLAATVLIILAFWTIHPLLLPLLLGNAGFSGN